MEQVFVVLLEIGNLTNMKREVVRKSAWIC
jgi:hypothetical protein